MTFLGLKFANGRTNPANLPDVPTVDKVLPAVHALTHGQELRTLDYNMAFILSVPDSESAVDPF